MESKKSRSADLESQRATRFLLGLVLVLALVFVALEYTDNGADDNDESDILDDLPQDIDLSTPAAQHDMVALMPKQHKAAEAAKVKVVDNHVEAAEIAPVADKGNPDAASDEGSVETGKEAEGDEGQTEALSPLATDTHDNPLNFHVVEDLPQFPGGAVEFMKWLTKNLRYPATAQQQKVEGKVVVQFIINRDGSVSGLKVVQALHPSCDREALRVMRMMPKWKPGVQHDKPCRTMVRIPIVFKL